MSLFKSLFEKNSFFVNIRNSERNTFKEIMSKHIQAKLVMLNDIAFWILFVYIG